MVWGPRNNVNMQQSALLIAMNSVAKNKETFLENYYLKNKHTIERGKAKAPHAYVVPAKQRRRVEAAELMNLVRREGAEVHTRQRRVQHRHDAGRAPATTSSGWISRTAASSKRCSACSSTRRRTRVRTTTPAGRSRSCGTSRPTRIDDKAIFDKPMTLAAADFRIPGTITGTGRVLIVDHTTDNPLVTFRFAHAGVKMSAAEREFEAGGHRFAPGAFVDRGRCAASRAAVERSIRELGLSAWAVDAAPNVPMHDLDVPRIGYVHTWTSTQDEGWVRLAFDNFKVPYTYFGAPKLREGNLRAKYDVIIFPHAGQGGTALITGGVQGAEPRPYKKTELTPNVGTIDSTDDMRGSIGIEGLMELYKFVDQGGVLITEGATSTVFPDVQLHAGRHGGDARQSLRPRLGAEDDPRRQGQPGPVWLRSEHAGGVFQSGAGDARGRRRRFGGGRGGGANVPPVGNMQPNAAHADADDAGWSAAGASRARRGWRTWRPRRARWRCRCAAAVPAPGGG